ncbi:MAG: hypothetical protein ACHQQQ_14110 [Bacteroidota bacterium]
MKNPRALVFGGLTVLSILIACFFINTYAWTCDDAYISFRYARNLVNGLGLVFNAGERVEGYTNFLWTMMIAAGMKMGVDPVTFTKLIGGVFAVGTITLLSIGSWKLQSSLPGKKWIIPFAALGLCIHHEANVYATGGLETSMFTFLLTSLYFALIYSRSKKSLLGTGVLSLLLLLTRPDGILFLVAGVIYLFLTRLNKIKSIVVFILPAILIYLPYWWWRYAYYGYFYPNTYYAKSIGMPYYTQGFLYLTIYMASYFVFLHTPVMLIVAALRYKKTIYSWFREKSFFRFIESDHLFFNNVFLGMFFIAAQVLFVIRIGGDFMFGRFFIPITPVGFFVIECLIVSLFQGVTALSLGLLMLLTTYNRINFYNDSIFKLKIADEWKFYANGVLPDVKKLGEILNVLFKGIPVRVAFMGARAKLVYYMDPELAIEAETGLTDVEIAHQEIIERGRPGHEKRAPYDYLVKRKVQIFFDNVPSKDSTSFRTISFNGFLARIVTYDDSVMNRLAADPGIRFANVSRVIDSYVSKIERKNPLDVSKDYSVFKSMYFDSHNDTVRENKFKRFLRMPPGGK